MKRKVGLDLDGIMCDFHTPFLQRINEELGTNHQYSDWTTYFPTNCFRIPSSTVKKIITSMQTNDSFQDLEPIKDSVEMVNKLYDEGHRFTILTDRPCAGDTIYWLHKNSIPYDNVYTTGNKTKILKARGLTTLIDDKVSHLVNARLANKEAIGLLHPWNEYFIDNNLNYTGIRLVKDWKILYEVLKK